MLSRERIDEIVRAYFHQILDEDQTFRVADLPEFDWKSDKDIVEALTLVNDKQEVEHAIEESGKHAIHFTQDFLTKITHDNLKVALEINDWREAELFVGSLIKKHGLEVPKESMEYRSLSHGVLRAWSRPAASSWSDPGATGPPSQTMPCFGCLWPPLAQRSGPPRRAGGRVRRWLSLWSGS